MKSKLTKNQQWYQKERKRIAERINRGIRRDYLRLAKQNKSKAYIMSVLQNKYRNSEGKPFSPQRIYNALDLRAINKEILALRERNQLVDA